MSPQAYRQRNEQLAAQFFRYFSFHPSGTVHTFLPIPHKQEPDTQPIIERLRQQGVTLVIAKSNLSDQSLSHYLYTPEIMLQPNRWGVPEPAENALLFPVEKINRVLVPLLAFDRQGNRVGYGKGYYDRFLSQCRPDTQKIGLSLEPPVDTIEDLHPLDIRLDFCVTPEQVWKF